VKDRKLYDSISQTYVTHRREDPRIARPIHDALVGAQRIVNIGAGTGNYEPVDRELVVAVEPSAVMLAKRPSDRGHAVQGVAEALPFPDGAFDAAMGTLTVHHWADLRAGLREMRRVAPLQVIFMYDPTRTWHYWALDYFPDAAAVPSEAEAPGPDRVAEVLDVVEVSAVPVPFDCTHGFGAAFWGRPEMYLDPDVLQAQSWIAQLPSEVRERCVARLRDDLLSGRWDEQHGHLRELDELDVGYRLVVARS
jgi:SAM-dependent methyltransferase